MPRKKQISFAATAVVAGALILVITIFISGKSSVIPSNIQKQVNFVIFYPQPSHSIKLQSNSFKYAKSLQQVSFTINFSAQHITFAEQSSPESFAADPNFYSSFIQKLGGYDTISSINGRVDLTRPPQVNSETAVMNAKGTLLFAKSSGNISTSNWTLLFNSLSYIQP